MNKTVFTIATISSIIGFFFCGSEAEALRVNFEPSVAFRNSYTTGYHQPGRIVRQHYDEVYHYHDPYTHQDYYYHYPVTREYVEYYPVYRDRFYSTGTDFNFKFKFR